MSNSIIKFIGIFIGNTLHLLNILGRADILITLRHFHLECGTSFHLFKSTFISFRKVCYLLYIDFLLSLFLIIFLFYVSIVNGVFSPIISSNWLLFVTSEIFYSILIESTFLDLFACENFYHMSLLCVYVKEKISKINCIRYI